MAYGVENIESEEFNMLEVEALEVRESYGLYDNFIDIFDFVVSKLGATIIPYSSLNNKQLEAACIVSKSGYTIFSNRGNGYMNSIVFYNDFMPIGNQRYTLAHETYHIINQQVYPTQKEESYAEYFAKVFLAPKCMVLKLEPCSIDSIKEVFGLSSEASQYMYRGIENRKRVYKNYLFPYEKAFLGNKPH